MSSFRSISAAAYEDLKYNELSSKVNYWVSGKEICPTTGRVHWQFFAQFNNSITFDTIKKWNNELKILKCINDKQSQLYCKKGAQSHAEWKEFGTGGPNYGVDAEIQEWGEYVMKKPGQRTDLLELRDLMEHDKWTPERIKWEMPEKYHQYGRTLEGLYDIILEGQYRTWETTCTWYHGSTGVGKSHTAFTGYKPYETFKVHNADAAKGFWCGYKGQPLVIINEFRGEIKFGELCELIDKWPATVGRKGRAARPFLARHVIITAPVPPQDTYHNINRMLDGRMEQLLRRIVVVDLQPYQKIEEVGEEPSITSSTTSALNDMTPDIEIENIAFPVFQRKLNII